MKNFMIYLILFKIFILKRLEVSLIEPAKLGLFHRIHLLQNPAVFNPDLVQFSRDL